MIGLIVDGEGDFAAFSARYKKNIKVMKADGPRGHKVSEEQFIVSAKKQILMLRSWGCTKIAIVTDFESRAGQAVDFCEKIKAIALRHKYDDILVFAPDRMLENWFLADIVGLSAKKKYLRKIKGQKSYESLDGKVQLKQYFLPGYAYSEVKHSAELFPLVNGDVAEKFSRSFAKFRRELGVD